MKKSPELKFKNGKFKIMVATDFHESYFSSLDKERAKSAEDMGVLLLKAVNELKPDLVVFDGDNAGDDTEMKIRAVINRIVCPLSAKDIPLAVVFGNHDRECGIDLEKQVKIYNEYDNCLLESGDKNITGIGNYNVLVKDSAGKKDILNLWFVDSNNLCDDREVSYYDWVHEDQIDWYKNKAKELAKKNNGKVIPSLWFQHIPVIEEYKLLRKAKTIEIPDAVKGHRDWSDTYYVLRDEVEGYLGEGPCCPCVNSGEFAAWKETGDVMGAFFGHDHLNDFAGYVDGILLAQCKTAGFNLYTDGCRSGVRMITLDENNLEDIKTKMYHFKQLGLKSKSLGPIKRNFTDRQVLKIQKASAVVGAVAATAAVCVAVSDIANKKD